MEGRYIIEAYHLMVIGTVQYVSSRDGRNVGHLMSYIHSLVHCMTSAETCSLFIVNSSHYEKYMN